MKPVADRTAPPQRLARPERAGDEAGARPLQQRFDSAMQRAQHRGLAPAEDAPVGEGVLAMPALRPLPPWAFGAQEDSAELAPEVAAAQSPSMPAAPARHAAAPRPAPLAPPPAAPPLPPTATAQALQRSALAASAPAGQWQLLLPGEALPLRAVELQRQPGTELSLRLQLAPGAGQPAGAAALERLRGRLARHAVQLEPGTAGRHSSDDEFSP